MLERFQGSLEMSHGLTVGRARGGLRPGLSEIGQGLVPEFGFPVMASEHGVVRFQVSGVQSFEGARDAAMQELASRRQELGVYDLADPVVGEVKALPGAAENPPPDQLFDPVRGFPVGELGGSLEEAELEFAP